MSFLLNILFKKKRASSSPFKVENKYTIIDSVLIVTITLLSLFTRLWKLGFPSEVVFDEVYFGNFTNA